MDTRAPNKGEQRYAEARRLIDNGMSVGEALQRIADDQGVNLNAVRTSYYRLARGHGVTAPRAKRPKAKAPQLHNVTTRITQIKTSPNGVPASTELTRLIKNLEAAQRTVNEANGALVAYCAQHLRTLDELRALVSQP